MASLRKRGSRFYVRYTDAAGDRHESEGFTERHAALARKNQIELETTRIKAGLIDPRDVDFRRHAARPIAEHLADYGRHLLAKGATAKHADLVAYRARRVAELAKVDRLADLSASRVQEALKALRDEGLSLQTVNHHRTVIRSFSKLC